MVEIVPKSARKGWGAASTQLVKSQALPGEAVRLGMKLVPLASLIALSRVALGVHYPTDVLGGALLGASIGSIGAWIYQRRLAPSQ